jgi:anti-sigma B factor antagonist
MGETGGSKGARVDGRGIRPPNVYAISERPAPAGVVLLELRGEFDVAAAPEARERLEQARAQRPRGVVLDLGEVTFADSSALRELLRADAALRGDGSLLVIAAVPPVVERLLALTRASDLLELAPTVERALDRLTG